jgi:hypothetical protein
MDVNIVLNAVSEANKLPNPNYTGVENYLTIYTQYLNYSDVKTTKLSDDIDNIELNNTPLEDYDTLIPNNKKNNKS